MHPNSPAHDTLWKLIKDIRFGMLTHRTSTGMLHAHPLKTGSSMNRPSCTSSSPSLASCTSAC